MDGRTVEFLSAGIPATIVPLPDGLPAQGERLRLDRVQLLKLRPARAALSLLTRALPFVKYLLKCRRHGF